MRGNNTDPVLMAVGVLLVIAVIGWIIAATISPQEPGRITKFSSSGKAFTGISCNGIQGSQSAECNPLKCRGCTDKGGCSKICRNSPPSCPRR